MPVEINDIPLIFIYAFFFALLFTCILFIISTISSLLRKKASAHITKKEHFSLLKVRTIGEQFDQIYLTSVVMMFLLVISILLMFPMHTFDGNFTLVDNWPFILIVLTVIFSLITFIDWTEIGSKRTVQKDMRKF